MLTYMRIAINEKALADMAYAMLTGQCDKQEVLVKPELVVR